MARWWVSGFVLVMTACGSKGSLESDEPVAVFAAGKSEVSLLLVGDISVARAIGELIEGDHTPGKETPARGAAFPFERIRDVLGANDLVFGNLECVLTDSGAEEAMKTYRIRAAPKNASALHDVGIDIVSVANNHALDFGLQGITSTLKTLKDEGVIAVGAQYQKGWAQPVTMVQVGVFRVGFLAYNQQGDEYKHDRFRPSAAHYDIDEVQDDIRRARPLVDFLVVSVHGGIELSHELAPWQEVDARAAIDAGADVWVGHHPHVVQPWTLYKGKVIAWSLGDFVFDKQPPWLIARNSPRLFLQLKLQRAADGHVVVDPTFLAGAQDPKTWQPLLAPDAFNVDSFQQHALPPTLRDLLPAAKVERVRHKLLQPCDRWEETRIPLQLHAYRWLAPRFACDDEEAEKLRPWETVATSAELFDGTLKHGIWAHPHNDGVLRLRFTDVKLGQRLEGFAGFPDWQIKLRDKARQRKQPEPGPASVRLLIAGQQGLSESHRWQRFAAWAGDGTIADPGSPSIDVESSTAIPCEPGTTALQLDTSTLKGQRHDIVVEISGGSGDVEGRFLFDLAVVP